MKNNFFRPTTWKIILTVVFILVIIYYIVNTSVACLQVVLDCSGNSQLYTSPLIPMCPTCMNDIGIILSFVFPLFIYLLFSYLISCSTIFIIDKLRRKK